MVCEKVRTPEAQRVAHIAVGQPQNLDEEVHMEVDPVVEFTAAWFEVANTAIGWGDDTPSSQWRSMSNSALPKPMRWSTSR